MSIVHWRKPDALGDILHQAWRPDAAEPTAIRARPEVHQRMLACMTPEARRHATATGCIGHPHGLPLIVDNRLPLYPGFEIYRRPPTERQAKCHQRTSPSA